MWTFYYQDWLIMLILLGILVLASLKFVKEKKKRIKVLGILIVGCSLIGVSLGLNGYFLKYHEVQTAATKTYSKSALMADFKTLKESILQKNPLAFSNEGELKADFDAAEVKIKDGMTEEEFYHLVNPLVVQVKCGHTNLSISEALIASRKDRAVFFPVKVEISEGEIKVGKGNEQYGLEEGEQILSINGNDGATILEHLSENISHNGDNLAVAYYIAENHFGYEYYEFIEHCTAFDIAVQDEKGNVFHKKVEGVYCNRENTAAWQLHQEDYRGINYYDYKINGDEAVLTVRVFFEGRPQFKDFLAKCFADIREKKVTHLTIDVRGNFGGQPGMAKELLSYLVSEETPYFNQATQLPWLYKLQGMGKPIIPQADAFHGATTLLIDGGCFSTCGHFCAVFKSNKLGRIKGENTGGGAMCTDGSQDVVLRNTGIHLHNAQSVYAVAANEDVYNVVTPDTWQE